MKEDAVFMDQEQQSFTSRHWSEPGPAHRRKKFYEAPDLRHWGSIVDLTRGLKLGLEDFPIKGGTRVT